MRGGFVAAAIVALLAMAVFFVINDKTVKMYAKRIQPKPIAEIALRLGIAGDQHLRAATRAMNQFRRVLPAVRAARHVPFNTQSRCEEFIGRRLDPSPGEPAGAIESVSSYAVSRETQTADRAFRLGRSGWNAGGMHRRGGR